jgi:hypothetical protein
MTQDVKSEFGIALVSWVFVLISKMVELLPELQIFAVFLAIISSFISIVIGLPKAIATIKKLFR